MKLGPQVLQQVWSRNPGEPSLGRKRCYHPKVSGFYSVDMIRMMIQMSWPGKSRLSQPKVSLKVPKASCSDSMSGCFKSLGYNMCWVPSPTFLPHAQEKGSLSNLLALRQSDFAIAWQPLAIILFRWMSFSRIWQHVWCIYVCNLCNFLENYMSILSYTSIHIYTHVHLALNPNADSLA